VIILLENAFKHYDLASLVEGKGLHSFDAGQDDIRQAVLDVGFKMDNRGWRTRRKSTTAVAKKQFDGLQERLHAGILNYTNDFVSGKISKTRWTQWVRHLLRESYQTAFSLGMKSSGASGVKAGVAQFDREWVESAVRQELKFFNRLLRQIEEGNFKGSLEKRVQAYSEALQNVFYSGRVMGTPAGHLIDWLGPNDRTTCNGCRFLIEHSPYTKVTLPTTPRAGDTRCLNNCRCRLVVRFVGHQRYESVERSHRSKRWYRDKLARLKSNRTL
jgi:hypothetical protein